MQKHNEDESNREMKIIKQSPPKDKDSHQKLLNKKSSERYSFQYENCLPVKKDVQRKLDFGAYQDHSNSAEYCYPKFLTCIGSLCIPFKIFCPCFFCLCCPCRANPLFWQQMKSYGLMQEWGSFQKILQPGLHVINPISQSIIEVNRQTKIIEYNQIGISKDNVQFELTVVLFYRVIDSTKLAYRLGSYDTVECIKEISTGTLRNTLGENLLQTIIQDRQLIIEKFTKEMNFQLEYWGIHIEISSIKSMIIDKDVQRTLEAVTQTKRLSQAMIINFKSEVECSKLIKQISQIISNEASFQIRYLNVIENIINTNPNENVIFMKMQLEDKEKDNISKKNPNIRGII